VKKTKLKKQILREIVEECAQTPVFQTEDGARSKSIGGNGKTKLPNDLNGERKGKKKETLGGDFDSFTWLEKGIVNTKKNTS